ncbi:hypothetical protein [Pseudoalteromonas luteoviolacea]|uniref:Uncharacterized protein n=1 Tax=Pseudoalteromonas luteoviolacea CPMOR-1 TaxID=1365248 RepID=A0A162B1E7_9GAMM|nr:hypothetical protein [Pseudoalteromonas luteoviolacea]KZN64926.1 hypothetical protein N473_12880 [Pseudoalteromonas luteoviolacea CPMOR-1]MBQ4840119.1 hypothetical protein [Pseudoalteromonas luteoviolacea]
MELAIQKLKEEVTLHPEHREVINELHQNLLHSNDETTIKFLRHILDHNFLAHPEIERRNQKMRIHNNNWRVRLKGYLGPYGLTIKPRGIMSTERLKEYGLTNGMYYYIVEAL